MKRIWLLVLFLFIWVHKSEANSPSTVPFYPALAVGVIGLNSISAGAIWGLNELTGGKGSLQRTYWMGLAFGAASAITFGVLAQSVDVGMIFMFIGLPVGNIVGYETSPGNSSQSLIPASTVKTNLIRINF